MPENLPPRLSDYAALDAVNNKLLKAFLEKADHIEMSEGTRLSLKEGKIRIRYFPSHSMETGKLIVTPKIISSSGGAFVTFDVEDFDLSTYSSTEQQAIIDKAFTEEKDRLMEQINKNNDPKKVKPMQQRLYALRRNHVDAIRTILARQVLESPASTAAVTEVFRENGRQSKSA